MRDIDLIIVHCADTRINQDFSVNDVRDWHLDRGWSDVGYHYYIRLNGKIELGRPIHIQGAHVRGKNKNSIGICFEGGKEEDGSKWCEPQFAQVSAFKVLKKSIDIVIDRTLPVFGHYEFSAKSCPNFDVKILSE